MNYQQLRHTLMALFLCSGAAWAQQPIEKFGEAPAPSGHEPLEFMEIPELSIPALPDHPKISPWSSNALPLWGMPLDPKMREKQRQEGIRQQRGQEQTLLLQNNAWHKQSAGGTFGAFRFKVSGGGGGYNPFDMTGHLDARRLMFPLPRHTRPDNPGTHVAPNGQIRR